MSSRVRRSEVSRRRGVTLIELLIAVSLLGMVSAGVFMALRVGLSATETANAKILANRRAISVQRILREELEGFIPARVSCLTAPGAPASQATFFQGEPETLRFVSSYSLNDAARGYPQILEMQVIPGDKGRGVRLIVNEALYTGPASTGASCLGIGPDPATGTVLPRFAAVVPGPRSFVLADKLAYCRFSYLDARPMLPQRWVPEWKLPDWPAAVRVEIAQLDADPSRVPLVSVTAPIHVFRRMDWTYVD
jgi:prepilin-type N-terminal cleavage/methylation domain-containing protein